MAAVVFVPAFVVGMRVSEIARRGTFPGPDGLVHEFLDAMALYVIVLGVVIIVFPVYVAILWPFCRGAPIWIVRVLAIVAAPAVPLAIVALPGRDLLSDYPLASAVATLVYGLSVAAGMSTLPDRLIEALKRLVHIPPK